MRYMYCLSWYALSGTCLHVTACSCVLQDFFLSGLRFPACEVFPVCLLSVDTSTPRLRCVCLCPWQELRCCRAINARGYVFLPLTKRLKKRTSSKYSACAMADNVPHSYIVSIGSWRFKRTRAVCAKQTIRTPPPTPIPLFVYSHRDSNSLAFLLAKCPDLREVKAWGIRVAGNVEGVAQRSSSTASASALREAYDRRDVGLAWAGPLPSGGEDGGDEDADRDHRLPGEGTGSDGGTEGGCGGDKSASVSGLGEGGEQDGWRRRPCRLQCGAMPKMEDAVDHLEVRGGGHGGFGLHIAPLHFLRRKGSYSS